MGINDIQFHALVEHSPEAIFVAVHGRFIYVNPAAIRLFGASSKEELLGQEVMRFIHPDDRAVVAERARRLYEESESAPALEEKYLRLDGTSVDVEVSAVPFNHGDEVGALVFVRDITQRKQDEAILRTQAERHETLLATSGDGFWICDREGRILEVNDAFSRMSGYTREELLQLRISDIEAVETPEDTVQHIQKIIETGFDRFETRHRRKNGEIYDVEILSSYWASQDKFLVFHREITEQKKAEAELSQNRELLRSIAVSRALTEAMGIGVIGTDSDRRVVFANPWAQQLLDIREEDMLGKMYCDVVRAVNEEGIPLGDANCPVWAKIGAGQIYQTDDWTFARSDGSRFPVSLVIAPITDNSLPAGSVVSFYDITARKEAEQALLNADRRKDEFLAMLAHELRNPLAPIRNAAFVLGQSGLDESRLRWAEGVIERQVEHMSRLVDGLLDVSRIVRGMVELRMEPVELITLINQVAVAVGPLFENRKQYFDVQIPMEPVWLNGDEVRLTQVLSNLLDNAAKYTQEGGTIELDASVEGKEIKISVRDNGQGITEELLPRVFDLFQQGDRTLDRTQGGLGIGLTLVRQLAVMHGGEVKVYSEGPGRGATFTVILPLVTSNRAASYEPEKSIESVDKSIRILIVEDDPDVAFSTAVVLEASGYEVSIAASGLIALEQAPIFQPQIVLLDIGLKGLDGFETAKRLRQSPRGGEMYLVAVTGYADPSTLSRAIKCGCNDHLTKPVSPDVLLALLSGYTA